MNLIVGWLLAAYEFSLHAGKSDQVELVALNLGHLNKQVKQQMLRNHKCCEINVCLHASPITLPDNSHFIIQGPVVQKPVNVNPGLKFNRLLYFVMFYLTTWVKTF